MSEKRVVGRSCVFQYGMLKIQRQEDHKCEASLVYTGADEMAQQAKALAT